MPPVRPPAQQLGRQVFLSPEQFFLPPLVLQKLQGPAATRGGAPEHLQRHLCPPRTGGARSTSCGSRCRGPRRWCWRSRARSRLRSGSRYCCSSRGHPQTPLGISLPELGRGLPWEWPCPSGRGGGFAPVSYRPLPRAWASPALIAPAGGMFALPLLFPRALSCLCSGPGSGGCGEGAAGGKGASEHTTNVAVTPDGGEQGGFTHPGHATLVKQGGPVLAG